MFQTIYTVLCEMKDLQNVYLENGINFSIPGWAFYMIALIALAVYVGIQVMLYLFMAFGLKHIYKKKGLKTNCMIWIPILQYYALIKAYADCKIFSMQKMKYALTFVIIAAVYYFYCFAVDVAYFAGDICYFLIHGNGTLNPDIEISDLLYGIYGVLELVFTLALCGAVIPFFKERTKNYFIFTLLCIFIPDLFPIFVFAFRKREIQSFGQYKVVYNNYGSYENGGYNGGYNGNPTPKTEEPFGDFSDKQEKTDYRGPFSDFSENSQPFSDFNDNIELSKSAEQSTANQPQQKSDDAIDNTTEDDDLFN